jgi:hypothetical protein
MASVAVIIGDLSANRQAIGPRAKARAAHLGQQLQGLQVQGLQRQSCLVAGARSYPFFIRFLLLAQQRAKGI